MFTRSRKRIPPSDADDLTSEVKSCDEHPTQRLIRSCRLKENIEKTNVPNPKRRKNYVAFPSDEEVNETDHVLNMKLPRRKRGTLKEIKDRNETKSIEFKQVLKKETISKTSKTGRNKKKQLPEQSELNNSSTTNKSSHTAVSSPMRDAVSNYEQGLPLIVIAHCPELYQDETGTIVNRKSLLNKNVSEECIEESTSNTTARVNSTFDVDAAPVTKTTSKSLRYENTHDAKKSGAIDRHSSTLNTTIDNSGRLNLTFDNNKKDKEFIQRKLDATFDIDTVPKISINSSEGSTSINILNVTPIHIAKSTQLWMTPTPLKCEETFTKDGPEPIFFIADKDINYSSPKVQSVITPNKSSSPYPSNSKNQRERTLNITRSIEKRNLLAEAPKNTQVAFCSPATLKREGTFTKDGPEPIFFITDNDIIYSTPKVQSVITPNERGKSLQSPGSSPYPSNSKNQRERTLNITWSIEKRNSLDKAPLNTKVAFCSPASNHTLVSQRKSRIIKSSLKGSQKSFVYEESAGTPKRSRTACENKEQLSKHQCTLEARREAIDRLSRPRSFSAQRPTEPQPGSRTKLPDYAVLDQKQFSTMESLDECQDRNKMRAKRLLVPNRSLKNKEQLSKHQCTLEARREAIDRLSRPKRSSSAQPTVVKSKKSTTKVNQEPSEPPKPSKVKQTASESSKSNTATSKPPQESANSISATTSTDQPKNTKTSTTAMQTEIPKSAATTFEIPPYTRFQFKLNLDVNPFSITSLNRETTNTEIKPNGSLKREITAPQLNRYRSREEVIKSVMTRQKTINMKAKMDEERQEARTIIKGVRSNRRFELQMKMRGMN